MAIISRHEAATIIAPIYETARRDLAMFVEFRMMQAGEAAIDAIERASIQKESIVEAARRKAKKKPDDQGDNDGNS